jgi:hypothetical protein
MGREVLGRAAWNMKGLRTFSVGEVQDTGHTHLKKPPIKGSFIRPLYMALRNHQ